MRSLVTAFALACAAAPASADPDHAAIAARALDGHILPGYERLAAETAALAGTAETTCSDSGAADRGALDAAYHSAFDAWMGVSHLGFGPAEEDGAAFAIAFWPDTRGATPRMLAGLIAAEDTVVADPNAFREVSVAARGLFALEQLLFDPDAPALEAAGYRCDLVQAIATDLAATADVLLARWRDPYGPLLRRAGDPDNPLYSAPEESTRALYSALTSGLQADIDLRLGRPLGTFEEPQPRRAEAWRSRRSLRNVTLSLAALRDLAATAFRPELAPEAAATLERAFDVAAAAADRVGLAIPDAVSEPQTRFRVEVLRNEIEHVQEAVAGEIGATLGIAAGFNSMDGD